jgi:hypothetical protein
MLSKENMPCRLWNPLETFFERLTEPMGRLERRHCAQAYVQDAPGLGVRRLARMAKSRRHAELGYRGLKGELDLGHYEGHH